MSEGQEKLTPLQLSGWYGAMQAKVAEIFEESGVLCALNLGVCPGCGEVFGMVNRNVIVSSTCPHCPDVCVRLYQDGADHERIVTGEAQGWSYTAVQGRAVGSGLQSQAVPGDAQGIGGV